jgi:hypothetical protein
MMANPEEDRKSLDSAKDVKRVEEIVQSAASPEQLLQGWSLLRDKTQEERDVLQKKVLRKLDWMFLPCVTAMLIMW